MATNAKKPALPVGSPTITPQQGKKLILIQISKGEELLGNRAISSDIFGSWSLVTRDALVKAFGDNSSNVQSFINAGRYATITTRMSEADFQRLRHENLQTKLSRLRAFVEVLDNEIQLTNELNDSSGNQMSELGNKIFLVHGHDEAALHEVARFLERLKQEVIILREQPNQGKTIIEKFENFASVGFAIVLLTPDDRAGLRDSPYETQKFRARQNVLLELGYFIGRLGRSRVCALHKGDIEIPSDYSGVIFIALDPAGGWHLQLAREIKAAGIPVDMNRAV